MKRCSAKPYEGQDKYIFASYCHRDRAYVFPIIEQLTKDGYRVWYDEGIDPGSEWPEIIARHLNSSAVCLAFITANSLNSHNCRREINFALLKKKYFISVILEPVQMSLGMEMQLSSSQSIFKYTLSSEKEFFLKLYEAKELENCEGSPNYLIEVSSPEDYLTDSNNFDKVREPFSDRWFAQGKTRTNDEETGKTTVAIEEAVLKAAEEEERRKAEEAACKAAEEEERRKTENAEKMKGKENSASLHIMKYEKTGETIIVNKTPYKIGRSSVNDDYVITGNRSVSRTHATFNIKNDICYIVDNDSLNKTYVNGVVLQPKCKYALSNGDSVWLYNERFIYLKYNN